MEDTFYYLYLMDLDNIFMYINMILLLILRIIYDYHLLSHILNMIHWYYMKYMQNYNFNIYLFDCWQKNRKNMFIDILLLWNYKIILVCMRHKLLHYYKRYSHGHSSDKFCSVKVNIRQFHYTVRILLC